MIIEIPVCQIAFSAKLHIVKLSCRRMVPLPMQSVISIVKPSATKCGNRYVKDPLCVSSLSEKWHMLFQCNCGTLDFEPSFFFETHHSIQIKILACTALLLLILSQFAQFKSLVVLKFLSRQEREERLLILVLM